MNYSISGSGAVNAKRFPMLLMNYFNYANTAELKMQSSYPNIADWEALIINELSASRPVYYSGLSSDYGHAFVCDGYRSSDDKFHFNWGWTSYQDGYYAIGALNPQGYTFNLGNVIVIGIKPKFIPPAVDRRLQLMSNKLDPRFRSALILF